MTRTMADYHEDSKRTLCQKMARVLGVDNIDIYRNWTGLLNIAPYILQREPKYLDQATEILCMGPLSDKRKKELRSKSKERWETATKLAGILGYRKDYVFNQMSKFDVQGILDNKRKAYNDAIAILKRTTSIPIVVPDRKAEDRPQPEGDKCDEALDHVKIMLWSIKKIGDPDDARRAFNRAYNLKKDLLDGD